MEEPKTPPSTNQNILNELGPERTNPSGDFFEFIKDLIKTGLIVFILAFALRYFVIQPYIVEGESMMPNYYNREYLLAEKVSYLIGEPKRGDVTIFKYPKNPSVSYIKRIIGLPGETIKISNNQVIVVNKENPTGKILNESYIPKENRTNTYEGNSFEKTLNENEYFVLGDNREHSSDSREWGVLPKTNISGRAWVTLYPTDRISIHQRVTYSLDELKTFSLGLYERALAL
ncbi:MAG TPA: signal peptidase I [bacterium]|nr:signal peptidase I [bacterium]